MRLFRDYKTSVCLCLAITISTGNREEWAGFLNVGWAGCYYSFLWWYPRVTHGIVE